MTQELRTKRLLLRAGARMTATTREPQRRPRSHEHFLIGFVGLAVPSFDTAFRPAVEVGWRLAQAYWGRGLATEAARAAITDGFDRVGLDEIVSMTVPANARSIRVMERLGMTTTQQTTSIIHVFRKGTGFADTSSTGSPARAGKPAEN